VEQISESHHLAATTWASGRAAGQIGCDKFMWIASGMSEDESAELRSEVLPQLIDFTPIYLNSPYLHRMLLRQHGMAELDLERYSEALSVFEELLPMEEKLLGAEDLLTAQCRAALAFVQLQLGREKAAALHREKVIDFVRKQPMDSKPAYRFLLPIEAVAPNENAYPDYQWLQYCFLYRNNEIADQQQMLEHFANELQSSHPRISALLRGE
jgi:tetratricopeptide (TPR) repeat protein